MTTQQTDTDKLNSQSKTTVLTAMLTRPEGATLKDMATALNWKENSVRGAMSTLAGKQTEKRLTSEKVDGKRVYRLTAVAKEVPEKAPDEATVAAI